jgi:hypothetical protein
MRRLVLSKASDNSLEALSALQADTTIVLRNGTWLADYPSSELVPGARSMITCAYRSLKLLT